MCGMEQLLPRTRSHMSGRDAESRNREAAAGEVESKYKINNTCTLLEYLPSVVVLYSVIATQYNIIIYNIQNRKTGKV